MRKYLELTPVQEKKLNNLLDEIRELEIENIRILSQGMVEVQSELKKTQQNEKIQQAYDFDESKKGSLNETDMMLLKLSGLDSSANKEKVIKYFNIGHCNSKTLLKRLNLLNVSKETLEAILNDK